MEVGDFKRLVFSEFGRDLQHATPGNVRDFLDRMQMDVLSGDMKGRLILEERATTYEEIIKDFFTRVLDLPREQALIMLWLLAFDLSFSAIELQQSDMFKTLFGEFEE